MVDTYNDKLDDGYYDITLNASYSDSITVYCHFNYTTQYAWTLIESFSLAYASYPRSYAFYEDFQYYEDYVDISTFTVSYEFNVDAQCIREYVK